MLKTLTFTLTLLAAVGLYADPNCPKHAEHMADGSAAHGKEVDARHDTFGMPHTTSTHSFRLFADGGAIELRANDAKDQKVIGAIRKHLQEITAEFGKADFSTPAFVHGYTPAGVEAMKRARKEIAYRYEPLPAGGRIRITTKSSDALAAIHDFLRFQVIEHRTANTGKVEDDK